MLPRRGSSWTLAVALVLAAPGGCGEGRERPRAAPLAVTVQQCKSAELGCPRPIFGVANLQASLAYYRDRLGFTVDWQWGEPADFASVTRGDATIFLGAFAHRDGAEVQHGGGGALWVFARDVDALHAELAKRGATIAMPPTDMPWGSRELHVRDRDGNLLRFGGPAKDHGRAR